MTTDGIIADSGALAIRQNSTSGDQTTAEHDGNGSLLHKYIMSLRAQRGNLSQGVDQPICMIDVTESNAAYYYHFDGVGSVIALTNSSGSVVNLYEYSVYGEVSASDPNHPNRFLFTGREFDKDTGLYYYRARYYNPYIGRFLQTDPAGYSAGMNWHAYCGNNSANCVDPSGLKWEDPAVRIILYNSKATHWYDYLCVPVSCDPLWEVAINISGAAAEKAGYGSSFDYINALFSGGLKNKRMAEMPRDEYDPNRPRYDWDTQVTIEGLWIYDHGNQYGDTATWPYDEAFMAMFAAIGKGLDALGFYGTAIHLRGCTSGPEDAYLLMGAAASGHQVTAPLGTLWVAPFADFVVWNAGCPGYAPWACSGGFGVATPTLMSAGTLYYPTNRYYGGSEMGQYVERVLPQAQTVGFGAIWTWVTQLCPNRATGQCVW